MSNEVSIRSKWIAIQMTCNNPETPAAVRTLRDWYRRWVRMRELRYQVLAEILDDAEAHRRRSKDSKDTAGST